MSYPRRNGYLIRLLTLHSTRVLFSQLKGLRAPTVLIPVSSRALWFNYNIDKREKHTKMGAVFCIMLDKSSLNNYTLRGQKLT